MISLTLNTLCAFEAIGQRPVRLKVPQQQQQQKQQRQILSRGQIT